MKISIIGLGFVGNAMYQSFTQKGLEPDINLFGYDKYKNGGVGSIKKTLDSDILFMALPTPYDENTCCYQLDPIYETCEYLSSNNYSGVIIIKSTVEPNTTSKLSKQYPKLQFVHNPEFLTARTAFEDFHNQKHIVLGIGETCSQENFNKIKVFYSKYYPDAKISESTSLESESMKIFCNCFYAVKVQFFTELFMLCEKTSCDYNKVKEMMIKNNWINPMHTTIPGPDGNLSYGGMCFPKDTNALNKYMESLDSPNSILDACIKERNIMREDNINIKKLSK